MNLMASSIATDLAVCIEHVDGSLNEVCRLFFTKAIPTPSSILEALVYIS